MTRCRSMAGRLGVLALPSLLLLSPVMAWPDTGATLGLRAFVLECAALALLAVGLAASVPRWERLRETLLQGPNLAALLLLGWAAASFARTVPEAGRGRELALAELLRLACGVGVYFAARSVLNSRTRLNQVATLLISAGVVASIAGLASYAVSSSPAATAGFANPQLLAAFCLILLPVSLAFIRSENVDRRGLVASVSTVVTACTLLLTQNRGAWIGCGVGLAAMAALVLRREGLRRILQERHTWLVAGLAALAGIGFFLSRSDVRAALSSRLGTLGAPGADRSLRWRRDMWSLCEQTVRTSPWTGAGIGSFPVQASRYAATAPRARWFPPEGAALVFSIEGRHYTGLAPPAEQVLAHGASLTSLPHNEYFQTAAETGLVGLGLYLAVLLGFFVRAGHSYVTLESRTRRGIVLASVGAAAAQSVDAFSNPAWHTPELSLLFWFVVGVGMTATLTRGGRDRTVSRAADKVLRGAPALRLAWQTATFGLVACLVVPAYASGVGAGRGALIPFYDPNAVPRVAAPAQLGFGQVRVGRSETRNLRVRNVGERDSLLRGTLSTTGPPFTSLSGAPFQIVPGQTADFPITVTPTTVGGQRGMATLSTNDRRTPDLQIPLLARAIPRR